MEGPARSTSPVCTEVSSVSDVSSPASLATPTPTQRASPTPALDPIVNTLRAISESPDFDDLSRFESLARAKLSSYTQKNRGDQPVRFLQFSSIICRQAADE